MASNKNTLRVNTMYGADGRLRTSYFEGDAAKVARKNVKAFNKELSKYEKEFAAYASLDIDSAKIHDVNSKYIFGKLGIAEKYVDYIPEGDMAESMGSELTAIAGSKSGYKIGIGAKIASKFQPFFEKQAEKHPKLQKLSDRVTKAANGGRMPLTADSAAMMRIAFDKKFYNDCRRPGANIAELRRLHDQSISNLTKMALFDGVERSELSAKFSEKLIDQMQIDETLTDIYSGMADGSIRLADGKPVVNSKGETIKVGGRTLFERSSCFVSAEKDAKGRNKLLDAWDFETREPQTIDEILQDYQEKLDRYAANCETEADFKRMLASDSYKNLERNVKTFAEADCPDDAAMFKYEFMRYNLESCKKWALEHDHRSPYANLIIPPPWNERVSGNKFVNSYSTDDYYAIDEKTKVHDEAVEDVSNKSDDELAQDMADECVAAENELSDIDKFNERLNALEAENKELKERLAQIEQGSDGIENDTVDNESKIETAIAEIKPNVADEMLQQGNGADEVEILPPVSSVEKVDGLIEDKNMASGRKRLSAANMLVNAISTAMALKQEIQEQYHSNSNTILDTGSSESVAIQSEPPLMLEQKTETKPFVEDKAPISKYYIVTGAMPLSYSCEAPIDEERPELGSEINHETMVVPKNSVMEVADGQVVSLTFSDGSFFEVWDKVDVKYDELTSEQLDNMSEITKEQRDTLVALESQAADERLSITDSGVDSTQSYDSYVNELNSVLKSIGIEPEISKPDFSGRIEKYGLDIDFDKLDYVEIQKRSDVYRGGMDDNGHERKDNYGETNESLMIYATSVDGEPALVCEEETGLCTKYENVSDALDVISGYLDQSAKSDDVSVYIGSKDGKKKYIEPVVADTEKVDDSKKTWSDRVAKLGSDIQTNVAETHEPEYE